MEPFFLADNGRRSPQAELVATLEGLLAPVGADPDQHVRCRFPARSRWLSAQLGLPAIPGPDHCPAFTAWARPDTLRSISLLLVSGYLGNPASSFGHSLLLFNHGETTPHGRLLDLSFNFGALVPENETTLLYVLRGLFGGYLAGFSDKLYFSHDQVYTHAEFRDIWNYELRLTPDEQALLVEHLWEITGRKFTYYFLSRNCAYRLAELLALATDAETDPPARLWYLPVELFFAIENGDDGGRIHRVEHIPSAERWLYVHRSRLNPAERSALAAVLAGQQPLAEALATLEDPRAAVLLDTLLAELDYREAATAEADPQAVALRDTALAARLRRPRAAGAPPRPESRPPPTAGEAPQRWRLGIETREGVAGLDLRWSPYLQDGLLGPEAGAHTLVVLDLRLAGGIGQRLSIDRLDLLRLRRRALLYSGPPALGGEAWSLQLGMARDAAGRDSALLDAGLGRVWAPTPGWLLDAMIDAHLAAPDRPQWLAPTLGLARHWAAVGTQLRVGYRWADRPIRPWQVEGQARWRLDRRWSVELDGQYWADDRRISLGLHRYW